MAKRSPRKTAPTPVEAIKHKESRINILTEELPDFVADDEQAPRRILYPHAQSRVTTPVTASR